MNATTIFDALAKLPYDFMVDDREDTPPQDREALGECPLSSSGNSSMRRDLPIESRGNNSD